MIDLSWATQKAIFDAIAPAVAPVTVVDALPAEGVLPDALVYFGDDPVEEIGGKDSRLERHLPSLHVMVQGSSRAPMRDLQEKIRAALHEQPIHCDGAILSPPSLQSSNGQQIDVSLYQGTQTFLIFAQTT